ncbi:hypothetical protein HYC85_011649 [Camellia sinensis]|uniref:Uncharacterized protein n=1 Tax=Camellia sinensis TaxID=4442 RepID=A0A7J7HCX7_CAMSI|nr:hypothetical protein HYC85_011649 [Camellia sinensis]
MEDTQFGKGECLDGDTTAISAKSLKSRGSPSPSDPINGETTKEDSRRKLKKRKEVVLDYMDLGWNLSFDERLERSVALMLNFGIVFSSVMLLSTYNLGKTIESMRYDRLRDVIANICHSQALISIDPVRARDNPIVVKNIPYFKDKKALEAEVLNLILLLNQKIGEHYLCHMAKWAAHEINLPLNALAWSEEDLKDLKKLYEMTVLLNAQREIADKILEAKWGTKRRQEKLNEMLEEKVRPYIQNIP